MQRIEHNGRLHATSATMVGLVLMLVALGGWYTRLVKLPTCAPPTTLGGSPYLKCHDLDNLEAIDASLAYKKPETKQPQKQRSAPPPEVKPEGVSHDENKVPDVVKKDEPVTKPTETVEDILNKHRNHDDDDDEIGKPTHDVGQFDGSEFGFADETKGDPYMIDLVKDLAWEYPKLLDASGTPVGCIHIQPDGKIVDTTMKAQSGNSTLDDAAERTLKSLKKLRDDNPQPVPQKLLDKGITEKWICFKFNAQG